MIYQVTAAFGGLNCLSALIGLVVLALRGPIGDLTTGAIIMVLALQFLIGASIVYASRQKRAGTEIGEKAYPATLVAYILFALFAYRWILNP